MTDTNTKKINWNEAPKGATHCDTEDVHFPWMRLSEGVWYTYNTKGRWGMYAPSKNELKYIVKRETTMIVFDESIREELAEYGFELLGSPYSISSSGKYLQLGAIDIAGKIPTLDELEAIENLLGYDFVGTLPVQLFYGSYNNFMTFRKR